MHNAKGLGWFDLVWFESDPDAIRMCTRYRASSATNRLFLFLVLLNNLSRGGVLVLVLRTRRLPSTIRAIILTQN